MGTKINKELVALLGVCIVGCSTKMKTNLETQIKQAESLDAIVVLGGEQNYSRSNHLLKLYSPARKSRKNSLSIILTGYQSGLSDEKPAKAESERMKDYLVANGVPAENISNETESKDTLTNIVYAQPLLQKKEAKKVGILTDKYHINRGVWSAKRVLGNNYQFVALPTEKTGSFMTNVQEWAIKYAQKIDLSVAGIKSGDQKAFEKYVQEKHPFYNKNAKGIYKTMINAYNRIQGRK